MLTEAKSLGNYLIVAVAQDQVIHKLKRHPPRSPLAKRIAEMKALAIADEVVAGDEDILMWNVLQSYQPAIIALGYDQAQLQSALLAAMQTFSFSSQIVVLQPYKPDTLHSSLLFGSSSS